MPSTGVLVVEDEVITGRVIAEELSLLGYTVTDIASTDDEVWMSLSKSKPDLVLMDIILKGSRQDGVEIATLLRRDYGIPVVYITAHTDVASLERAKQSEPFGYLVKPFNERDLHVAIETAIYKHRMEHQLALREAQLTTILNSTHDAVIATDSIAAVTYMNPAAENLTGWPTAEAIGKNITEILRLIDTTNGKQIHPVSTVLQYGEVVYLHDSTIIIDRNGVSKPVSDSASPIYSTTGIIDGTVLVMSDMTERQKMASALYNSETLFRNIFEKAAIGMALNAPDGEFLKVNAALCQSLGYSESELLSLKLQDISCTDDRQRDQNLMQCLLSGEITSFNLEKKFLHKNKQIVWMLISVSLVCDQHEQPLYSVAQFQNINSLKENEVALSQFNTELEYRVAERTQALRQSEARLKDTNERLATVNAELIRSTKLKDEFLANMSHELRTPLNTILGLTEALQEGVLGQFNERQFGALKTITSSGFHLLALINDILDVAKIEAGQVELNYTHISVATLCKDSLVYIQQQASSKNIQCELRLPPNLPLLLGDELRIRQVLINLLSNAVKFTPNGGRITLEVSQVHTEVPSTTQQYLRISIIDTGIGIAPTDIPRLFQPFIQIDSSLNRQYSGTGLGLALVKRVVELHKGKVNVSSQVGVGSCFMIDLPCASVSSFATALSLQAVTSPEVTLSPLPEPALILLVDDNEANRETMVSYLRAKGYYLVVASNGQEAIAMAKEQRPHLILMDIQMPHMDGLEAIHHIRLDPALAHIQIIALTALAMEGDCDRCLTAGANHYISKPINLRDLAKAIQQFLMS